MDYLFEHYNKFNEDKRLKSRHGMIEYINTMRYIDEYLDRLLKAGRDKTDIKIADIGAGTGAYCGPLSERGYDVSAVELIQHNLGRLKQNYPLVKAHKGNALKLKKLGSEEYDITLLFGPMYHLFGREDKLTALSEAKRITKSDGIIFVAYLTNDYGVVTYAFKEHHARECMDSGRLDEGFVIHNSEADIYDYIRLSDIDMLNKEAGLKRERIFSPDGPADYMRESLKEMSEDEFRLFVDYQYKNGERPELLGAGAHLVDLLRKQ